MVVAIVIVAMCTGGGVLGQTTTSLWGGGLLVGCKVGHLVVIVVSVVVLWHEMSRMSIAVVLELNFDICVSSDCLQT